MFCLMNPPIETTISSLGDECWRLGRAYVCERVDTLPDSCLASWTDEAGQHFVLRKLSEAEQLSKVPLMSNCEPFHAAGTSVAVWKIAGVVFKVKAWQDCMQSEAETICFVNQVCPELPTPEIIYTWTERDRSFLILRNVEGQTLNDAWPALSPAQRKSAAGTVAGYCRRLANIISQKLETSNGKGVVDDFLNCPRPKSTPSWLPQTLGPFTKPELIFFLGESANKIVLPDDFCFFHADLGPGNIILNNEGKLKAIIDWGSAAFYPRFWLATKPSFSAGFRLDPSQVDRVEWANLLIEALQNEGFAQDKEAYHSWRAALEV